MTVYCEPVTAHRDHADSLRCREFVFAAAVAVVQGGPDFDYEVTIRTAKENAV